MSEENKAPMLDENGEPMSKKAMKKLNNPLNNPLKDSKQSLKRF